ncbi:MAG: CPBP family intramembrane glutamic endopeptidase [Thermotaleaceae bacterium]
MNHFYKIYYYFSSMSNPILFSYMGLSFILSASILIHYIGHFHRINRYLKFGLFLASSVILMESITAILLGKSIIGNIYFFLKLLLFSCTGIYCSRGTSHRGIPFLRRLFTGSFPPKFSSSHMILYIAIINLLQIVSDYILFVKISPEFSITLDSLAMNSKLYLLPVVILSAIEYAFHEEIIFRLGIQSFIIKIFNLEEKKHWIALLFTAFLWSIAHANTLTVEWVKFVHVFPLGIALGILYRKFGLECAILTHALVNLLSMVIFS